FFASFRPVFRRSLVRWSGYPSSPRSGPRLCPRGSPGARLCHLLSSPSGSATHWSRNVGAQCQSLVCLGLLRRPSLLLGMDVHKELRALRDQEGGSRDRTALGVRVGRGRLSCLVRQASVAEAWRLTCA